MWEKRVRGGHDSNIINLYSQKNWLDFIRELPSISNFFFLINMDVLEEELQMKCVSQEFRFNYFYCNIYLILKLSGIYYFYLTRLIIIYKINDNSRILFYYFYIKYY